MLAGETREQEGRETSLEQRCPRGGDDDDEVLHQSVDREKAGAGGEYLGNIYIERRKRPEGKDGAGERAG